MGLKKLALLSSVIFMLLSNTTANADDEFIIGGPSDSAPKKSTYVPTIPSQTLLHKNADRLFHNKLDPVGNVNGEVTLIMFFDYRCSHSRNMAPVVDELIKKNPNLRVVFKEFPIFGSTSIYAAKAALAAKNQDKFYRYHISLFYTGKELDDKEVIKIAEEQGLDTTRLTEDINSKPIQKIIQDNIQLAKDLDFRVVPIIIIGTTNTSEDMRETPLNKIDVFIGETDPDKLQASIDHHKPLKNY